MTAFDAAPLTLTEASLMLSTPFGPGSVPYTAKIPALAKSHVAMRVEPRRSRGRRPTLSMKIKAGTVMTTLITYWIEEDTSRALPVNPAIVNT